MDRENCNNTVDDFRRHVPQALANIFNQIILAYSHRYRCKVDLYKKKKSMDLLLKKLVQHFGNLQIKIKIDE